MAYELTQIQIGGTAYDINDASADTSGHAHGSAGFCASSHTHYINDGSANYSTWGTIGSIHASNSTTTAIQMCSWGTMGHYSGYFKNKNAISVGAIGNISSNNGAYTITVTAARPISGATLYRHNGAETFFANNTGAITIVTSYSSGATRTATADSIDCWFGGLVELSASNIANAYKITSTPG